MDFGSPMSLLDAFGLLTLSAVCGVGVGRMIVWLFYEDDRS